MFAKRTHLIYSRRQNKNQRQQLNLYRSRISARRARLIARLIISASLGEKSRSSAWRGGQDAPAREMERKGCGGWKNFLRIEHARRAPAAGSFLSQGYGPLLLSILFSFSLLLSWFVLERLSDTRSISLNWARNYDSGRRR